MSTFLSRALTFIGAIAVVTVIAGAIAVAVLLRQGFGARPEPSRGEAAIARFMRNLSTPARVKALANPVRPSPEVLDSGRAHWADHCAQCHGNDGKGQTPIGKGLYPRAPDMTAAATQKLTDGELYHAIQDGIRLTGMPAWGEDREDDEETWALVHFIRHLPAVTPDELRQMESMNPRSAHEQTEEREEDEFLNGPSDQTNEPKKGAETP